MFGILAPRMSEQIDRLPTIEELNAMPDLSGITLYSAELRRLPHYSREEEAQHIEQARLGDDEAKTALLNRCLPWLMKKATDIYVALPRAFGYYGLNRRGASRHGRSHAECASS